MTSRVSRSHKRFLFKKKKRRGQKSSDYVLSFLMGGSEQARHLGGGRGMADPVNYKNIVFLQADRGSYAVLKGQKYPTKNKGMKCWILQS